jgi:hypothetical protein
VATAENGAICGEVPTVFESHRARRVTQGATTFHPAQIVGPNAEETRALSLRYHIAVCPVMGLNRR